MVLFSVTLQSTLNLLQLSLCVMNLISTMKEDVTANQGNFFKVRAFSWYTLEKSKHLRFLLSNYVPEKPEFAKLYIRVLLTIDVPYTPVHLMRLLIRLVTYLYFAYAFQLSIHPCLSHLSFILPYKAVLLVLFFIL